MDQQIVVPETGTAAPRRRFFTLNGLLLFISVANGIFVLMLMGDVADLRQKSDRPIDLSGIDSRLEALPNALADAVLDADKRNAADAGQDTDALPLKSTADASALVESLGEAPTAAALAAALTELDNWVVAEADVEAVEQIRLTQIDKLRQTVVASANSLAQQALAADRALDGYALHANAQAALAYYPVDTNPAHAEELRTLLAQQAVVASKLDALQRMRYNNWASSEITKALRERNRLASWKDLLPRRDKRPLVDAVAKILAPIDPAHLEPATQSAYSYAINRTTGDLDEEMKTRFSSKMTKSDVVRIRLDQF